MDEMKGLQAVDEVLEAVEADETEETVEGPEGLSPTEAALLLGEGFDGKGVRRALRSGDLIGAKIEGRWYIQEADLDAFVDSLTAKAAAAAEAAEKATEEAAEIEEELSIEPTAPVVQF